MNVTKVFHTALLASILSFALTPSTGQTSNNTDSASTGLTMSSGMSSAMPTSMDTMPPGTPPPSGMSGPGMTGPGMSGDYRPPPNMTDISGMSGNFLNFTGSGMYYPFPPPYRNMTNDSGMDGKDDGENGLVKALVGAGINDPPTIPIMFNPKVYLPSCGSSLNCNMLYNITIGPQLSGPPQWHEFTGGQCIKLHDSDQVGRCFPFEILPLLSCPSTCDLTQNNCFLGVCTPKPPLMDKPCPVFCAPFQRCIYGVCVIDPTRFNTDLSGLQTAPSYRLIGTELGENIKQRINQTQLIQGQFQFGGNGTLNDVSDGIKSAIELAKNVELRFEKVSSAVNAAFQIAAGARVNITDTLQVLPNKTCAFIFDSTTSNGFASIGKLNLQGALKIAGSGIFEFPSNSNAITINDGASAIVSQGVGLQGNGGKLTINIDDPSPYNRQVKIPIGQSFETLGDIISTTLNKTDSGAPDALLQIAGIMTAEGTQIQPRMQISDGGILKIDTQPYQGTNGQQTTKFLGGDLLLNTGSQLQIANGNGPNTYFNQFQQCDSGATINYQLTTPFSQAASGTILNYAASTNTTALKCNIQITDSTGATISVVNPNAPTTSGASRRLLSTSPSATWGSSSLTYSSDSGNTGNTGNAATGLNVAGAIIVPTILASLMWG